MPPGRQRSDRRSYGDRPLADEVSTPRPALLGERERRYDGRVNNINPLFERRDGLRLIGASGEGEKVTASNPLFRHTAPAEAGAAFRATREGGLALVEPLTPRARAWLEEHVDSETQWAGDVLVVEVRYFPALADAIIAAGFTFERDTLPN